LLLELIIALAAQAAVSPAAKDACDAATSFDGHLITLAFRRRQTLLRALPGRASRLLRQAIGGPMIKLDLERLLGRLNGYTKSALETAAGLSVSRGNYEVGVEHLREQQSELGQVEA
jgi:hypothetical protein